MKKLFALIICLVFILPTICLAQDSGSKRPTIGAVRVGDDALFNDEAISCIIDGKTAALFDEDKYNFISFNELQPAFEAFSIKNNLQNSNDLNNDILVKFAKEKNLDYLLFMNFNLDDLLLDKVFFKSTYRAVLGTDIVLLNAEDGEAVYTNHLIADGSAADENTACKISAKRIMRRIKANFDIEAVLEQLN